LTEDSKNLNATETGTVAGESQKASTEAQIVKYLIHLKNSGRREATIEARDQQLKRLLHLGPDLNDSESVKNAIASLDRTESYKALLCIAYEGFARKNGIPWTRPNYKQSSPLPFVPHESEVDALISGSGKKTATLLRLLKESAMRLGEAWLVEWIDVDSQNHTVICRNPEKNSRSRAFEVSAELCQMLLSLPHNSQYIFSCSREPLTKEDRRSHLNHLTRQKGLLSHQRRRTAEKLKNPRIAEINYHSLRHWKATQLYHQTKDVLYVMKFLGHRDVKNTLIYIDLESVCYSKGGEDYHAKTARTETEAIQLVEAGFEYVCDIGEVKLFRKRK
jgi:integrase